MAGATVGVEPTFAATSVVQVSGHQTGIQIGKHDPFTKINVGRDLVHVPTRTPNGGDFSHAAVDPEQFGDEHDTHLVRFDNGPGSTICGQCGLSHEHIWVVGLGAMIRGSGTWYTAEREIPRCRNSRGTGHRRDDKLNCRRKL